MSKFQNCANKSCVLLAPLLRYSRMKIIIIIFWLLIPVQGNAALDLNSSRLTSNWIMRFYVRVIERLLES